MDVASQVKNMHLSRDDWKSHKYEKRYDTTSITQTQMKKECEKHASQMLSEIDRVFLAEKEALERFDEARDAAAAKWELGSLGFKSRQELEEGIEDSREDMMTLRTDKYVIYTCTSWSIIGNYYDKYLAEMNGKPLLPQEVERLQKRSAEIKARRERNRVTPYSNPNSNTTIQQQYEQIDKDVAAPSHSIEG